MTDVSQQEPIPEGLAEALGRYYEKALLYGVNSVEAQGYRARIADKHGDNREVSEGIRRMQAFVREVQPDGLGR